VTLRKVRMINPFSLQYIKKYIVRIIFFVIFTILLLIIPYPNVYFQKVARTKGVALYSESNLPPPPPYPINKGLSPVPVISAEGVYIKDINSGAVIYSKNGDEKFSPASTTKIITSLVALDKYNIDEVLTVKSIINDGRTMGLVSGEKLTFETLLYGALVHSANDAAYTIAENYPGGIGEFIKKMNEKTTAIHLNNSHYTNPIGFDDNNQYTTPSDLAKQAIVGLSNKTFSKIVGTKSITVSDISYTYFHSLINVNELLGKVPGVSGVKTGFTQNAGEVLVSEVKKNGRNIIVVVLKSRDRFGDTVKLVDWVFNNFEWLPINEITPAPESPVLFK